MTFLSLLLLFSDDVDEVDDIDSSVFTTNMKESISSEHIVPPNEYGNFFYAYNLYNIY